MDGTREMRTRAATRGGFTLVELLLVIAVIGIMSALIISSVTNAARDSRLVVARQQQAVLQEALNAWITAASGGTNSLLAARTAYNSAGSASAKLELLRDYLQPSTYDQFSQNSSGGSVQTDAMKTANVSLGFSAWSGSAYPTVEMNQ